MRIPSDNIWTQTNEGNKFGVLSDTFNVDLETPGQLITAKKSVAFLHSDVQSNLNNILALLYYNNSYVAVTPNEVYEFDLTTLTSSTTSAPSGISNNSDAVICFDRMYVSLNTDLSYWNGSSWTTGIEVLTTGVPHPLEVFDSLPTFKLAIGDGNTVILVDSAGNKDSTVLTLPAQFRVTTLRYRNGYLYVGTRNMYGGEARVFIWNGSGTSAQYEVPVGASWVFSMVPYGSSVALITSRGQLLHINGSSADMLAALPVYYAHNIRWQTEGGNQFNGKVFNRGMSVVGQSIFMNIDGDIDTGECLDMKSGLWVFNPKVGLYHYAQASSDRIREDTTFTISGSEITTTATHYLKDGDGVVFTNVSSLSGVITQRIYYVKVTDINKIRLSKSRTALKNADYITCSGTGTMLYAQNRDQGDNYHTSGAIGRITAQQEVPSIFNGELMYGALVQNLDGTSKHTVQVITDSYNVSRFSTQRIYSDNIEQSWKEDYQFIDGLILDNEAIVHKEQTTTSEVYPLVTGTWSAVDTINIDISGGNDLTGIVTGDEVVLTEGYGRGYTAFITNLEPSASTIVITLDESLGTIGQSVSFFNTKSKKINILTRANLVKGYLKSTLFSKTSSWLKLKSEIRGFKTELTHIELSNKVHTSGN